MYLRNYKKTSIKFRTDLPDYTTLKVERPHWEGVYHPCTEDIPENTPQPRGKPVITTTFKDANLLFDYVLRWVLENLFLHCEQVRRMCIL